MMEIVLCLLLLQIKHLIVDWCWQPAYEWQNKGTYGHWGGVRHALKNAVGTALCFVPFVGLAPVVLWVLAADFVAHYHIDLGKVRLNRHMGWGPTTHEEFWWLTGADQAAHQICYLLWVACVFVIWM
jgi:hypothetical protein